VTALLHSPLDACLTLLALWGLIGLAGLLRPTSLRYVARTLYPLGALCGAALALLAFTSLSAPPERAVLIVGLPDLPMHLRRDARMQDSAEGFGQPIRHIFEPFFVMKRELPSAFDHAPRYRVSIGDRIWQRLYEPLGSLVQRVADTFAVLQQGRIATYLLYSFVTLVALLAVVL
jgi:hypothetical protein